MHRRVRRRDEENCRARETPCRGCGCGCSSYAVRMLHVQNDSLFHYRRAPLYCIGQRPNELLPSIRFSNCGYHKYRPTYGEFVRRNSSAASARNRKLSGSRGGKLNRCEIKRRLRAATVVPLSSLTTSLAKITWTSCVSSLQALWVLRGQRCRG